MNLVPRVRFRDSKANQEDKGAGEDLGLQRCEWLTPCIIDDDQERGLTSGVSENFDSDENVRLWGRVVPAS